MKDLTYNEGALLPVEIEEFASAIPGYAPTGDTITCKHTTYRGNKTHTETWVLFRPIDGADGRTLIIVKEAYDRGKK